MASEEAHWLLRPPGNMSPGADMWIAFPGDTGTPLIRLSRAHVEALVKPSAAVQVSRAHVEALVKPSAAVQLSRVHVEVLVKVFSGTSIVTGRATVTSTARALTAKRVIAVGRATEADTARALTRLRRLAVGRATVTNTARALTSKRVIAVGRAAEADTARTLTPIRRLAVGRASEADTARALTAKRVITVARASETDTARGVGVHTSGSLPLLRATETDTARALSMRRAITIGRASETDTARALVEVRALVLGRALETETARSLSARHSIATGRASETDTARALSTIRPVVIGRASELDTARALTIVGGTSSSLTQVSWDTGRWRDGIGVATWDPPVVNPPRVIPAKTRAIKAQVIDSVTIDGTHATPVVRTEERQRNRHRVVVGGVDVTYFRGVETPEPTYGLVSPLLWGSGSITFPQIHAAFERPGHGELWWLTKLAPVKVQRVDADGNVVDLTYHGLISDFDRSGRTLSCTLGGQATGRAALQDRPDPIFAGVTDIGDQALGMIRNQLRLPVGAIPATGIATTGAGADSQLDFLTTLMAQSTTLDGRQWTVMPNDDSVYHMHQKDLTTIDFTVYLDDKRAVGNLRRDFAEEPNRVYASAIAPDGGRIRFAIYPGLTGKRPPFPGVMSEGDTGDGVTAVIWRLFTMGYVDGGADDAPPPSWGPAVTKAVKRVQDAANLTQTGVVNLDTWKALFDNDVTGWSLRRSQVVPAARRAYTHPYRRSASGQILGRNPAYDRTKILVDTTVDMGPGFTGDQVHDWSVNLLDNDLPNYVGTIDLTMGAVIAGEHNPGDPFTPDMLMDARAIKPGMNAWLPTFDGGVLIHTSGAELQEGGSVQLTVDTRARDTMAVWEVISRNRASKRHPARQWIAQNRRSGVRDDTGAFYDRRVFGKIERTFCPANQWTTIMTPAGRSGMLQKVDFSTDTDEALYVVGIFGKQVTARRLGNVIGDPTTIEGSKNWAHNKRTLTRDMWMVYSAGLVDPDGTKQLCGFAEPVDPTAVDSHHQTASVDAGTDTFTIAGHGYSNGHKVYFTAASVPAGLTADNSYFVVDATTNTFKVRSSTSSSSPMDITADATGVDVVTRSQAYPPITGQFSDEAGLAYFCKTAPVLCIAIFPDRDTWLEGGRVLKLLLDDASG